MTPLVATLERSRREACTPADSANAAHAAALLRAREDEVAQLAVSGLHDKDIAHRLQISVTPVRTHIDPGFRKLNINNGMALARRLDS